MSSTKSKRDEIIEAAESMIRTAGYNGFSTREVANSVGIKAASVHYHFPTKTDLVIAVTQHYSDRFLSYLDDPAHLKLHPVQVYIEAFRIALTKEQKLCLCLVLGAEAAGLPKEISLETRRFFQSNIQWLSTSLNSALGMPIEEAEKNAAFIVASLEGALILSTSLADNQIFETIAQGLLPLNKY